MGDNRKLDVSGICSFALLIIGKGEVNTIEDPLLSGQYYQLLPLATSQFMGNNRELDVSGVFQVFNSFLVEGSL